MSTDAKFATVTIQTNHGLEFTVAVPEQTPTREPNAGTPQREPNAGTPQVARKAATAHASAVSHRGTNAQGAMANVQRQ